MWISGISLTAATIFCPQRAVWISNIFTQRVWKEFFHPVVHSESFQLPQAIVESFKVLKTPFTVARSKFAMRYFSISNNLPNELTPAARWALRGLPFLFRQEREERTDSRGGFLQAAPS